MGAIESCPCTEFLHRVTRKRTACSNGNSQDAKRPTWPKEIRFVRHGESQYNVVYDKDKPDPLLWDAPLTDKGMKQACALTSSFREDPPELSVTSPLTRAIQTCLLAVPSDEFLSTRYEVWAEAAEHLEASCDIGSSPAQLEKHFKDSRMDFRHLPEIWWFHPEGCKDLAACQKAFSEPGFIEPVSELAKRVDASMAKIGECKETSIALFAHADYLNHLLDCYFEDDRWLKNCEVVRKVVSGPKDLIRKKAAVAPRKESEEPAPEPPQPKTIPRAAKGLAALRKRITLEMEAAGETVKPADVVRRASLEWKGMDTTEREQLMNS